MAIMVTEIYDALRAASVPEKEARNAAEIMAVYRTPKVESDLLILKWMVGTNVALTIALMAAVGGIYLRLIDIVSRLPK